MEKLKEASRRHLGIAMNRLQLVENENDQPLKTINDTQRLICSNTQREYEGLMSQLDFIQLVNQKGTSVDLEEGFKNQIENTEKLLESLELERVEILEVAEGVVKLAEFVVDKLEEERRGIKSYAEFLLLGYRAFEEEMLEQTKIAQNKLKMKRVENINLTITKLKEEKGLLLSKREELDEYLKAKSVEEERLMATKVMLEQEVDSEYKIDITEHLDWEDKNVFEANYGEVKPKTLHNPKVEAGDVSDLDVTFEKEISHENVRETPIAEIINIDDSSEESNVFEDQKGESSEYIPSEDSAEASSSFNYSRIGNQGKGQTTKENVQTRCNQKQLHCFLSGLIGEKRRVIEESIFKQFLNVSPRNTCTSLVHALIKSYNIPSDSFMIGNHPLKFCSKEVERCLGIKFGGRHVDFTTPYRPALEIISIYFGRVKNISKDEFLHKLKDMHVNKSNADDFFRLSVLFMFNIYFFPSKQVMMSYWPLRYLVNLEDFKSYGWGRAIYDCTMDSLRCAAAAANEQISRSFVLKGCVPLLEALVYERVGVSFLKFEVDPKINHPAIIKYRKGDTRNFTTLTKVLKQLKFEQINKCDDCSKEEANSLH